MVLPLHIAAGMLPVDRVVCETPWLATALEQPRALHRAGALVFHFVTHWFALILLVGLILGLTIGPRTTYVCFGETKVDIAKLTITKYAVEAYPQWRLEHPSEECPRSFQALDGYMDHRDHLDPWGRAYVFTCGNGKLYVMSLGGDGRSNTADDIWSHQ